MADECRACTEIALPARVGTNGLSPRRPLESSGSTRRSTIGGAAFFVSTTCVAELHELLTPARAKHLMEMAEVAEAVLRSSGGRKMNYEALANSVPHLHWWLTPRHFDDPRPQGPIWEDLDFLRQQWTGGCRPDASALLGIKTGLFEQLQLQDLGSLTALFVTG